MYNIHFVNMYSHYNFYFSDPNNDTEALNLEVRGNCTFHWFKDSNHIIPSILYQYLKDYDIKEVHTLSLLY